MTDKKQEKQPKLNEAALKQSRTTKETIINNNSIVTKDVKKDCDTKPPKG